MPFNKSDLVAQECPELVKEYKQFKKLEGINKEKLKAVQQYLKYLDEGSLRKLSRLFKRIEQLMWIDEKEEVAEKRYTLHFLHQLKEDKYTRIQPNIKELIKSLEKLSELLSLQLTIIHSDKLKWGLRSNFQDFIQLVLKEQKIIKGDLLFLDGVTQHYRQQINEELIGNAKRVKNIGHRGARGLYAENTLGSMKVALGYGVDMIEFDIQICKTGEVIVMHDYTIDRTTTGHGLVKELTWGYLDTLHMKETNEKIPTLEDVIRLLKGRCGMNIEIKAHNASGEEVINLTRAVIKLIKEYGITADKFIVSSFNHAMLRVLRSIAPWCPIGTLFEDFGTRGVLGFPLNALKHLAKRKFYHEWGGVLSKPVNMSFVRRALAIKAIAIYPPMDIVGKGLIALAHEHGLKVSVWTVNNPYVMMQFILWGVDGIITDRPDILLRVKNSLISGNIPDFSELLKQA